ncbi:MAG: hypothetical protein R2883_02745 [Caldisericia bacterium]
MINFNLGSFPKNEWMFGAIILYVIIMFALTFGNYLSVKLLKPEHKDTGRIFYSSLIWFCTYITVAVFTLAIYAWTNSSIAISTVWAAPVPGMNLIVSIITLIAIYFETKFLFGYDWIKAILAVIIPIVIAIVVIIILWYAIPGWVKGCLFPFDANLILF